MRLFVGIPVSPEAMERLATLRLRQADARDGLRWSTPEQWHLTLRFFGEVEERAIGDLISALSDLASPSAELTMTGLGLFANKGILYAEFAPSASLESLQRQVNGLAVAGEPASGSRPFHPHVTLARAKGREGQASLRRFSTPALPSLGASVQWQAREMLLYRSELQPAGAVYTVLARFVLG